MKFILPSISDIRASLDRQRTNGTLSDENAVKTVFFFIDRENGILGKKFSEMPYEEQVSRLKMFAELRPVLDEYFESSLDELNLEQVKNMPDNLEGLGVLDKIGLFASVFGENAASVIAPNSKAISYVFRNAWWIIPTGAAIYLFPLIRNLKNK